MTDVREISPTAPRAHIQDFLISRELAEVYLLLDNVSSVKFKLLPEVPVGDKLFSADESWIQQVCEIAWPPDGETVRNESLMAAQLIRAKDMLNSAAAPATGASIAFTTLITGDSSDGRPRRWWHTLFGRGGGGGGDEGGEGGGSGGGGDDRNDPPVWPPTRGSLAALAYPNLAHTAWLFRSARQALILFLVLWLILTCFFSWDVATGSALLNRIGESNKQAIVQGGDAVIPVKPTPTPSASSASVATPAPRASASPIPAATPSVAASPPATKPIAVAVAAPLDDSTCQAADPKRHESCERAWGNLRHWLKSQIWPRSMFGCLLGADPRATASIGTCLLGRPGKPDAAHDGDLINLEWAAVFVGILAGTILPIAYGVLGAAAAVVRGISMKMRDYTLMPRDIILAGIQLALGAVIGACIGLFVGSDSGATNTGGLIASVPLTQSALCFVAGFGVEGVFQALEALVRRVFNLETDKPAPAAQAKGAT